MAELQTAGELPVSELIEECVVRAPPEATLTDVACLLVSANIGVVVLGAEDKVIGIVSERDIARAVAEGRNPATTQALDVASTSLIWCDANATVAEIAAEMMDRYVRHLLVEVDGQLVGIVSARDLLGAYGAAEEID